MEALSPHLKMNDRLAQYLSLPVDSQMAFHHALFYLIDSRFNAQVRFAQHILQNTDVL